MFMGHAKRIERFQKQRVHVALPRFQSSFLVSNVLLSYNTGNLQDYHINY